ncbi:hypothetical protein LCGC14_2948030 [marine sediment metagenome]|uniref:MmcB family DNA repair protein n=1 Tax=marine sediment metagenome TaxID=412755 RepID=A0A0F9A799_9ZZZZ
MQQLTTHEIVRRLATKYSPPAWAFLPQVRNRTGFGPVDRTADGLAMSLCSSRGLGLVGFEVKSHRGDWLRELKNPSKAETIFNYCNQWYVVAGSTVIVQEGELPKTWGLMVPHGSGLSIVSEAPERDSRQLDNSFLAAILRKVTDTYVPRIQLKGMILEGRDQKVADAERDRDHWKTTHDRILKKGMDFAKASGVNPFDQFSYRDPRDLGKAFRMALNGQQEISGMEERLRSLRRTAEQCRDRIDQELKKGGVGTK